MYTNGSKIARSFEGLPSNLQLTQALKLDSGRLSVKFVFLTRSGTTFIRSASLCNYCAPSGNILYHVTLLTHWSRVMHISVSKLTTIGSDNGLSPGRCQANIWTNAGILLIGPLGTNLFTRFLSILEDVLNFSSGYHFIKWYAVKKELLVDLAISIPIIVECRYKAVQHCIT